MLTAKRSISGLHADEQASIKRVFTAATHRTRQTLRAEADPARLQALYAKFRQIIGMNIRDRMKADLLFGEPARKRFEWEDGDLDLEPLMPMPFDQVASFVPTEKKEQVLQKWFGKTERERALGLVVLSQMYHEELPDINEWPSCLHRYYAGDDFDWKAMDRLSLAEAKELCRHWRPLRWGKSYFSLGLTTGEMREMALKLVQTYAENREPKNGSLLRDHVH